MVANVISHYVLYPVYKYILTCCCYFTKWSEAILLKDKSAYSVANALFKLLGPISLKDLN